jgi:hypothetical protein
MEKVFKTANGVSLYAVIEDGEVKTFVTDGSVSEVKSALEEDINSKDYIAKNMATILLSSIEKFGCSEKSLNPQA